jgi:mono/diheme cytochrome c family protein
VLPHRYDGATQVAVPIVIALAASQLLFAWNIVQTLRGAGVGRVIDVRPLRERLSVAGAEAAIVLIVLGLLFVAGFTGWAVGHYTATSHVKTVRAGTTAPTVPAPSPVFAAGRRVFENAGCSGCHTLKAAGATGTVGPNLDQAKPSAALVVDRVTHGKGAMPSFSGQLTPKQIQDVATYVSQAER